MQAIFKQILLANKWDPIKYYHSRARVDLGVMAMKGYYTLPISLELEPCHQI